MTVYKLVARVDDLSGGSSSNLLAAINNALADANIAVNWSSISVPEDWQDQEEDLRL